MRSGVVRVLEDVAPTCWALLAGNDRPARLPLDAYETEEEIIILASVPGLKPEDVHITVDGDTLTIRGRMPSAVLNVTYLLHERAQGAFSRSLKVYVPIDVEHAEARFLNGVLTLVLPKVQEAQPKRQRIPVDQLG
jgi:HSP20 family protein